MDRFHKVYKGKVVAKSEDEMLAENLCPSCGGALPEPVREDRGSGYSEMVTNCGCGATLTGGI